MPALHYGRMPVLPEGVECYRRTQTFDEHSIPTGLTRRHELKAGTWGRILVSSGSLRYVIEASPEQRFELSAELPGIVEPGVPHRVEAEGPVRFLVEFHR